MALSRRAFLGSITAALAGGCGKRDESPAVDIIADQLAVGESATITRERVNKLPYASMAARIGDAGRVLVVLATQDGARLHWMAADKTSYVTRYGRVVQTAGLPGNLRDTRFLQPDPLTLPMDTLAAGPQSSRRTVDLMPGYHYGTLVEGEMRPRGNQEITIYGSTFKTLLVEEACHVPDLDWHFTNRFWRGVQDGLVWRSIQFLVPTYPALETFLLKPVAGQHRL